MKAKKSTGRKLTQIESILVVSKIGNDSVAQTAKRIEDYIKTKSQEEAVERCAEAMEYIHDRTMEMEPIDTTTVIDIASGIQYGTFEGQCFPVGTRLTSLENGELIIASPDTPDDLIVGIVEPDK